MIAKELHIYTRLELDKINSGLYDDFQDEEIDYYLNKAQIEFIKHRYSKLSNQYLQGFEFNEKRTVDLKNLHVTNYIDTCYTTSINNQYRFRLPEDFMLLTSEEAQIYYNYCGQITTTDNVVTKTYFEIPLSPQLLSAGNYRNFRLYEGSVSNSILSPLTGYFYPTDNTNFILKLKDTLTYPSFYEGYYTIYKQNTLFIEKNNTTPILVSYDNGNTTQSFNAKTVTLQNKIGSSNGTREYVALKRVQIDDLSVMLKDSFAKPSPDSPLAIEQSNYIDSYTDGTFIIEQLNVSYIRKPKPISLSLNITSELSDTVHHELIAMAVNMMLEAIESRRYETNNVELKRSE